MTEKTLCFIIEQKNLYLDKILVDINGFPIFFVCKEGGDYYLVTCYDTDDMKYYVSKISVIDLRSMICGKKPMLDAILSRSEIWDIVAGDEMEEDVIKKIETDDVNTEVLPRKGVCYRILSEDIKEYVDSLLDEKRIMIEIGDILEYYAESLYAIKNRKEVTKGFINSCRKNGLIRQKYVYYGSIDNTYELYKTRISMAELETKGLTLYDVKAA